MGAKALKPQFRGRVNPRGVMVVRNIRLMRYYIPSRTGYLNLQPMPPPPPSFIRFIPSKYPDRLSLSFSIFSASLLRNAALPAQFVVFNRRFLRCRAKNSHSRRIISNSSILRTFIGEKKISIFSRNIRIF